MGTSRARENSCRPWNQYLAQITRPTSHRALLAEHLSQAEMTVVEPPAIARNLQDRRPRPMRIAKSVLSAGCAVHAQRGPSRDVMTLAATLNCYSPPTTSAGAPGGNWDCCTDR